MKRLLLLFSCAFLWCISSVAQKYILDHHLLDSIPIYEVVKESTYETLGNEVMKLPLGQVVEVTRQLKESSYAAIRLDGKEYGVTEQGMLFSDENPEGVEDIFGNTREDVSHSWQGKFFGSFTPYAIITILFVVAIAFMFIGMSVKPIRFISLIVVPVSLFVATMLEFWAYWTLGNDAFWWCSMDTYGFWGSFLRAIPFVIFVAFQLYSLKGYECLLLGDKDVDGLSIKPAAISLAICIPLTIATLICFEIWADEGLLCDIVCISVLVLSLSIGILISFYKNAKILGFTAGLFFTLFSIVYILGTIVAVIGLVVVLFQIILQILMIIGCILAVLFVGSHATSGGGTSQKSSTGNWRYDIKQNEDGTWRNAEGGRYETKSQAESAARKNY